jgi:hypothetical protein
MLDLRQQITTHLDVLSGDQVKAVVLNWLSETNGTLADFESLLVSEQLDDQDSIEYGTFDDRGEFQPLTEEMQIQQSLEALEEYRLKGGGVSHDRVSEWLDSIGTDRELPCPQ